MQHLATLSKRTGLLFSVKAQLDATDVIKKAAVYMFDKRLTTKEFFVRFDDQNIQKLGKKAIATIIRVVMKAASPAESSVLVKEFIKVFDMDCDGSISIPEWERAMEEGQPRLPELADDWGTIDMRTDFKDQGKSLNTNTIERLQAEHAVLRKVWSPCRACCVCF